MERRAMERRAMERRAMERRAMEYGKGSETLASNQGIDSHVNRADRAGWEVPGAGVPERPVLSRRRFGAWAALGFGGMLSPKIARPQPQPAFDLEVAYVSLEPRYPAYDVRQFNGAPLVCDPETQEPLNVKEARQVRRWPKPGEIVTATARVVNFGSGSAPFRYEWHADGKKVAEGVRPALLGGCQAEAESVEWRLNGARLRTAPLRAGAYTDITWEFPWRSRDQVVEFRIQPLDVGLTEELNGNNRRAEQTTARSLLVVIRRQNYNEWARLASSPGGQCFEAWLQRHVEALREKLEHSTYASAPRGARLSLRVDLIRVVDDNVDLTLLEQAGARNGWDALWSYPAERDPATDQKMLDWDVVREFARLLGVVDLAAMRVDPGRNHAPDPITGRRCDLGFDRAARSDPLPLEDQVLPEHTVLALNRQLRTRGGFSGVYLYSVPRVCRLRVLDNNGSPMPDAEIAVFQLQDGSIPPEPIATGVTNVDGEFPLPNRPAAPVITDLGFSRGDNPFGNIATDGSNGLLLIRIRAREHVGYQWLPITAFNLAYWRGSAHLARFDLRTQLPSRYAPQPPADVQVRVEGAAGEAPERVCVTWRPSHSEGVVAYYVYRALGPLFQQFERVGEVVARGEQFSEPTADLGLSDAAVRYVVTAVDVRGNESAVSSPVTLSISTPHPPN